MVLCMGADRNRPYIRSAPQLNSNNLTTCKQLCHRCLESTSKVVMNMTNNSFVLCILAKSLELSVWSIARIQEL